MSGATLSSRAILRTLEVSGREFATRALGLEIESASPPREDSPLDTDLRWIVGFLVAAILLRLRPGRWRRRAFLLASVLVLGFLRNLQYSSQHVFSLLALSVPEVWFSAAFVLVVVVPLVTFLVGNLYCGYVCPFGALQELVGEVRPKRLATDPATGVWRYGRLLKYGMLFLLVLPFAGTRDYTVLAADPLTTFFGAQRGGAAWVLGLAALVLSVPFRRFWCRNLCPVGAFLSLLNGARLLRMLSPPTRPGGCDLGVRNIRELDCLRCDRCLHEKD